MLFELLELGYNLPAYWRNRKIVKSIPIGLIYERHAFFMASTAWLARQRGVPLVVEVNELVGDARVRKQPLLSFVVRRLDKILFRQASVIVVVSPHLKRRIQALGISGDKILVLPNAVDEAEYARQADGSAIRQQLGLEDDIVVGFVGWFVSWHRLDHLVEAFSKLATSRPRLKLVLVGEGPVKEDLKKQIKRLGMTGRVVFAGALPHDEIPSVIAAMDVCIVPHSNEYRSPIKLFEYMGQGRLVVAPGTEPVRMVVRHGENGLLFSTRNQDDLTEALARGVDDPDFRDKAGRQARSDILAHYTWRENVLRVLNGLTSL
jgi:glycosyltransferase involved in cell wall biosynthesis